MLDLGDGCKQWQPGGPTFHGPKDATFMEALIESGFSAYTHEGGLFGGIANNREIQVIHRGMGRRWELFFREHDNDVVITKTTDLPAATVVAISWLRGEPLTLGTDALAVATRS